MKKLLMLFIAGLFSAGAAIANEDVKFTEMDQDGDGQLSRTEVAQNSELAAQFSTLDADGDGYLSEDEANSGSMQQQEISAEEETQGEGEDY